MTGNALGFIETIGLTAAIEAADAAVKSANVRLLGYELARGDGMTTVKVEGDVGAVKSAVKAAELAAAKVGKVVSTHVIPRPAAGTERIVLSRETVGLGKDSRVAALPAASTRQAGEVKEAKKPRSQPRKAKASGSGAGGEELDLQPEEKKTESRTKAKAPEHPPDAGHEEPALDTDN